VTLDEAHCISEWDSFQPKYSEIGHLHWILPLHVPFHCASATMPPHILQDVKHKLRIEFNAVLIHRTINRPNIFYQVNEMIYPVSTRWDL
ncbi:hypothetical protein SERLA73DRAFT_38221, partial [Serpula lacrymans var. lacrymans S7.3]